MHSSLELHDPDPLVQAAAANTAKVDCYVGLRLEPGHESANTYFYRGFRYESAASRQLAELLVESAANRLELGNAGAHGMADVILRRTAMPAVVLELGRRSRWRCKLPASERPSRRLSNAGSIMSRE